jgi:hypothetical protein
MREIRKSGLMSGMGNGATLRVQYLRPSSTLLFAPKPGAWRAKLLHYPAPCAKR